MKRFLAILLVVLMTAALTGCCLKHDMQPATCTQPSTCSKCGKTEGEPLGHTEVADPAKEPTCTETGLTEGSHCSVCGEVFKAQEEIPALGHDWEEATFSKPQTCRVCGATGEDALGSELFIRALTEENEEAPAEADAVTKNADDEAWEPILKTLHITAKTSGLDEVDEILANSKLDLTVDIPTKEQFALLCEAVIQNSDPMKLILTADKEVLCFTLPGISEGIYRVSYETLKALYEANGISTGSFDMVQQSLSGEATAEKNEAYEKLALQYAEILFGLFNQENTTETTGAYQLELIGATEECTVLSCQPTAADWQNMLSKLFETALADKELEEIIRDGAKKSFPAAQTSGYSGSEDSYVNDTITEMRSALEEGIENVEQIANVLAQYHFEVAYRDGRLYAVRLTGEDADLFRYESAGTLESGRTDKIQIPIEGQNILLTNTVKEENGKTVGRLSVDAIGLNLDYSSERDENDKLIFDYNLSVMGVTVRLSQKQTDEGALLKLEFNVFYQMSGELNFLVTDGGEHIVLPAGELTELSSEEEIAAALEKIGNDFENAGFFG